MRRHTTRAGRKLKVEVRCLSGQGGGVGEDDSGGETKTNVSATPAGCINAIHLIEIQTPRFTGHKITLRRLLLLFVVRCVLRAVVFTPSWK